MENKNKKSKFDFNTIKNFDEHINKSIPNYDFLVNAIKSISDYFVTDKGVIYDIGCSTGKLLKSLPYTCNMIGIDNSNLLPKTSSDNIKFLNKDITKELSINNAQIVYSIFTLQFISQNRYSILRKIYNGINEGGAVILAEKIYQEDGKLQEILTFSHYDYKSNYFKIDEIFSKEKDLRFIMKPKRLIENIEDLKRVGFRTITTFYQAFNFVGIIAIK